MTLAHNSAFISVTDAKIKKVTADPAGGTTTYGSSIDVPDMTGVTLEGSTDVKIRRGDGTVRDRRPVLTEIKLTFTNTTLPLDVVAALQGGTVTDSGTTPNQVVTYAYNKSSTTSYVRFECQCTDTDFASGDAHLVIYKARVSNFIPLGFTDDNFQTYSFELGAVSRNSDDKIFDIVFNETAVAIS